MTSKNDIFLCKLDIKVKNQTVVAGCVGFLKFDEKPFKGKSDTV